MEVHGQVETMVSSYTGLLVGLVMSIVLVYLLIVVNFQSWLDPFIIITALPGALAGILWMLFLTHTALSVPALTGAVMCMGSRVVVMSARPGRIKLDRPVPIAHPRHYSVKTTAAFSEIKAALTEQVRVEVKAAQRDMAA